MGRAIPLSGSLTLQIEASSQVLETGDNAYTESTELIRWWVDPRRGVTEIAQAHLVHAFAHEAFHATRFRRLGDEAGSTSLVDIAIGEGLATAFARDTAGADDPWAAYDPMIIRTWWDDLVAHDDKDADLQTWKLHHPDGREWIAFRVGVWIIDQVTAATGRTAADLIRTLAADLAATYPI